MGIKKTNVDSVFARNLMQIIDQRRLSQKALSEIAGVQPPTITDWLSGSNPRNFGAILKICLALDIDFQWLLTGIHKQEPVPRLNDFFDIQNESNLSGIFQIDVKRLKQKSKT